MKIAMAGKKPLPKSHIITQAKVGNSEFFEMTNIKQPIQCNFKKPDKNVKETKENIVAVAKLSNPLFDCTIFSPGAGISEILSHANRELRDALTYRGFNIVTPESEGGIAVFAKYNALSSDDNAPNGEVWLYLDRDDVKVQQLLLTQVDGSDGSQSEEAYDDGSIHGIKNKQDASGECFPRESMITSKGSKYDDNNVDVENIENLH